jgi:aspartate-semialdehyde dehydrogenase
VTQALVPSFFGHAVSAHVELKRPALDEALAAWRDAPGVSVTVDPEIGATLDAPEGPGILVARVDDVGASTIRIWALGSEAGASAAARAIALSAEAGVL